MIQTDLLFDSRKTQEQMVLEALQRGDQLTPLEAQQQYGIMRLAAIIHRLRRRYAIEAPLVEVPNRRGQVCHVARYKYVGQKEAAPKDGL